MIIMLKSTTIKFLKELKTNNNKDWFESHRLQYEAARQDIISLITQVITKHSKKDPEIAFLQGKDCMFRINRDVRFSKDKSPYKINFGASINKGGKKSFLAGYYFHCEPGSSFAGGGVWMPEVDKVKKLRQEIDYNFDEFKKIVKAKKFITEYKDLDKSEESSLQREPKGYEKTNPAIDYIKLKSWVALKPLTDEDLTGTDCEKKILAAYDALQPLVYFINHAIEE